MSTLDRNDICGTNLRSEHTVERRPRRWICVELVVYGKGQAWSQRCRAVTPLFHRFIPSGPRRRVGNSSGGHDSLKQNERYHVHI
jgi:hypothetical protein